MWTVGSLMEAKGRMWADASRIVEGFCEGMRREQGVVTRSQNAGVSRCTSGRTLCVQ